MNWEAMLYVFIGILVVTFLVERFGRKGFIIGIIGFGLGIISHFMFFGGSQFFER